MMKKVTVLKLAGETGLRLPGSTYFESDSVAVKLAGRGIVKLEKEEKTVIETKEEKFKPATKAGRPKRRS